MKYKLIIGIALIIAISSCIIFSTEDVSAGTVTGDGTQASPYTYVNINSYEVGTYFSGTKYVEIGTSFTVSVWEGPDQDFYVATVTPGHGLNIVGNSLSGTLTGSNGDTVTIRIDATDGTDTGTIGTYSFVVIDSSITYTITWNNWDGTTLETDTGVTYGSTPTYNGATPTRASTQYSYSFNGWNPAITAVTGNQTYTAQYTQTPIINIIGSGTAASPYTFVGLYANNVGTYFTGTKYVEVGTSFNIFPYEDVDVDYYVATVTSGHGLTISDTTLSGTVTGSNGDTVTIRIDATDGTDTGTIGTYSFVVIDSSITYTITWNNWDGTTLETDTGVTYGSTPSFDGTTPIRMPTSQYSYTFTGWAPSVSIVTGNQTYTATYQETVIENVVGAGTPESLYTFINLYESHSRTYLNGTKYICVGTEFHLYADDDGEFGYYISGFTATNGLSDDGNYGVSGTITGNNGDTITITVYATDGTDYGTFAACNLIVVDPSVTYTITWQNWDGTTLETDTGVTYAITPTYNSATPTKPNMNDVAYTFIGWSPTVAPITGNTTYIAQFTQLITYWSNGNPNGSISILFYIDQSNVTNEMNIHCPLYKYNPIIEDDFDTEINESFVYTDKYLNINLKSQRSGTTNVVSVIASLHNNDHSTISVSEMTTLGSWKTFIITIDTINAEVTYTKVMGFRSFTNYEETTTTGAIFSYGSLGDYNGQVTQDIQFNPGTIIVPKQSIIRTSVFLNTYGVVLRDPSLDISTYFPEMTQMRLNFYSFALYGSSMTINGHTIDVTAPNVTIYYTSTANGNTFSDILGTNIKEKTLELKNIYITWDGLNCYLTFADDNFTVDMGSYTNKVVSFTGMWYFATALWEPYTAQETTYDIDWFNFDFALFGIIFATMLLIASLILKVTIGAKFLDYIIIVCGIIIGLIIAGGSL